MTTSESRKVNMVRHHGWEEGHENCPHCNAELLERSGDAFSAYRYEYYCSVCDYALDLRRAWKFVISENLFDRR